MEEIRAEELPDEALTTIAMYKQLRVALSGQEVKTIMEVLLNLTIEVMEEVPLGHPIRLFMAKAYVEAMINGLPSDELCRHVHVTGETH